MSHKSRTRGNLTVFTRVRDTPFCHEIEPPKKPELTKGPQDWNMKAIVCMDASGLDLGENQTARSADPTGNKHDRLVVKKLSISGFGAPVTGKVLHFTFITLLCSSRCSRFCCRFSVSVILCMFGPEHRSLLETPFSSCPLRVT